MKVKNGNRKYVQTFVNLIGPSFNHLTLPVGKRLDEEFAIKLVLYE